MRGPFLRCGGGREVVSQRHFVLRGAGMWAVEFGAAVRICVVG